MISEDDERCLMANLWREALVSFTMDIWQRIEYLRLVSLDVLDSVQMDLVHLLDRWNQLQYVQKHVWFICKCDRREWIQ